MISLMNFADDMTIEGLSYIELIMILNSNVTCGTCVRIMLLIVYLSESFLFGGSAYFAYDKTVINQRKVEKTAFENQSEENSVK